jgi:transposase
MNNKKKSILKSMGSFYPNFSKVQHQLFLENDFFDSLDIVQVKYEMLRSVHIEKVAIREAAKTFGFSRTAFYQIQSAFEQKGLAGLISQKRGPKNRHKLRSEIMQFILSRIEKDPRISTQNLVIQVKENFEVVIHSRSIARALKSLNKNEKKKS